MGINTALNRAGPQTLRGTETWSRTWIQSADVTKLTCRGMRSSRKPDQRRHHAPGLTCGGELHEQPHLHHLNLYMNYYLRIILSLWEPRLLSLPSRLLVHWAAQEDFYIQNSPNCTNTTNTAERPTDSSKSKSTNTLIMHKFKPSYNLNQWVK